MRTLPFLSSPLILAPIAGPGSAELVAAVCEAGAFGILASPYSTPDRMLEDARSIRERTQRPFGINLFIDGALPAISREELKAAYTQLTPYYDELGLTQPADVPTPPDCYREQIDALLKIKPAVFSFTFGIPDHDVLTRVKAAGIFTIGTATTVDEAIALERAGVDAVCAQGAEAGGHRGSFGGVVSASPIGTIALVPQVVDAVALPVIAAGGITDGRGIAAALALGAVAAQCGTAFLLSAEARTSPAYRDALRSGRADETVLTTAFSGRMARGIRNRFALEMDDAAKRAPYPYQNALTRDLRAQAAAAGRAEVLSLWAGQAFPLAKAAPAAEIVERLLREAHAAAHATRDALAR